MTLHTIHKFSYVDRLCIVFRTIRRTAFFVVFHVIPLGMSNAMILGYLEKLGVK